MQAGLPEVVKESIDAMPEDVRGACWANIVVSGGNFCCPGMESRLCVIVTRSSVSPLTQSLKG